MTTPLGTLLAFFVSFVVHGAIFVGFIVGLFALEGFRDRRLPALVIACLVVVTVVGFVIRRRWATRWNLPVGIGLIVAGLATTTAFLCMSWVLSYPVMEPPPFLDWLGNSLLRDKNAGLWIAGPVVLASLASALGYALGGGLRSKSGDTARHNSRAV
jgi:cell division protein FtsW (lipid II flippase)